MFRSMPAKVLRIHNMNIDIKLVMKNTKTGIRYVILIVVYSIVKYY